MQLEALPALYGDALLLHYGNDGLIMIDGGPKTVWTNTLRPRLKEIKDGRSPNDPLPVRLVMVSHIDEDHIKGILDLAAELDEGKGEPIVAVQELWHNAFTDIAGDEYDVYLKTPAGAASISSVGSAFIASVTQGKKLHELAKNKLGWVLNDERPLMMAGSGDDTVDVGGNVKLTILGPSRERLEKLRDDWRKKLKPKEGAKTVAYEDLSPPNLGSLIVLASDGTKKILLTGDGRGDYILEGLENAKLMPKGGKFEVDVLKVPHHGSIRDLDRDFFERIVAKDYVISANGKYKNPDIESLELLLSARGDDAYNVRLTYPVDQFDAAYDLNALQKMVDESQGKKYKIIPRDPKAKSVVV